MRVQPEMSRNVQKYSKEVYLRASEAQQCRVHSTVVLPLFTAGDRGTSLGIIEVVQTRQDMSFEDIVIHLAQALEVTFRCITPRWHHPDVGCLQMHSRLGCTVSLSATNIAHGGQLSENALRKR